MKSFVILSFLFIVSSCGFQPLYASRENLLPKQDKAVTMEIAKIYVNPIENYIGMIMRQELRSLLSPQGVKKKEYSLSVTNKRRLISEQGIRSDNIPTRITIGYDTEYVLRKGNEIIFSDQAFAQSSYNVLSNAYSTDTSEKKVEERLIQLIAKDIALRITVFFKGYMKKKDNALNQEVSSEVQ